jgi:SAM-dependent methyltransferase
MLSGEATVDESLRLRAHDARARIKSGALRGTPLLELVRAIPRSDRDAWIDHVLGIEDVPADTPDLPRGAVPYLPCGVDQILAMVLALPLGPEDELVDLGAGIGRVVLLAHLLTGARCVGVEIQAPLVARATALCSDLGIRDVSFVLADAADAEIEGSIFFMYAPFNGDLLARVLARLEAVAKRRTIVVCTVDLELHAVPWLVRRSSSQWPLHIYDSSSSQRRIASDPASGV